jgi:plastocyanin
MKRISVATVAVLAAGAAIGGLAASSTPSPTLPRINVAMNGTSIAVSGSLVSGAVNVVSTTTHEDVGQLVLFRLNPGVTPAQVLAHANTPDIDSLSAYGSIVADAAAPRGVSAFQTSLQPGQYVAVDVSNSNPAKQPYTGFTVAASAQPAALPVPRATISAIDFGFRGATTLRTGTIVRFVNRGYVVHMIIFSRLNPGADPKQVIKTLRTGTDAQVNKLPVSGNFAFGLGPVMHGGSQQMTLHAAPGTYVIVCYMDTQSGIAHFRLGMERIIHIIR